MYLCLLGVVLVLAIVRGADADNPYYSIWPNFHTDNAANTKITDDLNSRIDPSKIWISKSKYLGIMYWYAPLSDDDKAYYSSFPGVSTILKLINYHTNLIGSICGCPHFRGDHVSFSGLEQCIAPWKISHQTRTKI